MYIREISTFISLYVGFNKKPTDIDQYIFPLFSTKLFFILRYYFVISNARNEVILLIRKMIRVFQI